MTLDEARQNAFTPDFSELPRVPNTLGVTPVTADLASLRKYIDWTPFFLTWSLAGKYPRILNDEVVGEQARELFEDANAMLDTVIVDGSLTAKGVMGLFPANRVGDDIEVYQDESRSEVIGVSHHLRQQTLKQGFANLFLQPCYDESKDVGFNGQNFRETFDVVMNNPGWNLSLQTHKWMGVD